MITTSAISPRVGVVIVSWNVRDLLWRCLGSLDRAALPVDVVVVDNASTDGSPAMVEAEFPRARLVLSAVNLGFTGGNNRGLEVLGILPASGGSSPEEDASGEHPLGPPYADQRRGGTPRLDRSPAYVLLLNPDAELVDDALGALVRDLEAHPEAGVVGPLLVYPDGRIQSSRRRFPTLAAGLVESTPVEWHWRGNPVSRAYRMEEEGHSAQDPPPAGPVDWVTGAAMLFRAPALAAAGGFDEDFFMYAEELDLCRRLAGLGWRTRFTPAAVVIHHEGQSSEQAPSARQVRFARSRVRYFAKHHGGWAAFVVRAGLAAAYLFEAGLEATKWLLGHKRPLRRSRIATYLQVIAALCYRTRSPC